MSSEVKDGSVVSVHYKGTLDDETEFDNSYTRGEPLNIQIGLGQLIPGFEKEMLGMKVNESKTFTLSSDEAYGPIDPQMVQMVGTDNFPPGFEFQVGAMVQGTGPQGEPIVATVQSMSGDSVMLDFNHPMAGKNLTFAIEVVGIEEQP